MKEIWGNAKKVTFKKKKIFCILSFYQEKESMREKVDLLKKKRRIFSLTTFFVKEKKV